MSGSPAPWKGKRQRLKVALVSLGVAFNVAVIAAMVLWAQVPDVLPTSGVGKLALLAGAVLASAASLWPFWSGSTTDPQAAQMKKPPSD